MTLGRNLSWVVFGIVLSTNAHADGATIAQKGAGSAAACQSCHGGAGESVSAAGFPRLAGLGASYLQRQLEAFSEGARSSAVMMPIPKALSTTDRKAVASHYAAVGATLATRGRWSDTLPACEQCHGPGGRGVGAFDYWGMDAYTQRKLAALRQASPDVPASASASAASKDIAGDPPHAELVAPSGAASGVRAAFRPPSDSQLPTGEFGDVIRRGREIFVDTGRAAPAYVGNSLRCVNCHLDAGRLVGASPLWAAFVSYPAYRSKTKSVSTFQQRLQSCFEYSMNGKAPPSGAPELVALESYAYWLATGAAVDPKLPGRGYSTLPAPAQGRDYTRGEQAWDVALYMNSHERPQDPRNSGSVRNTRSTFHDTDESMYSRDVAGKVLGSTGAPQPFKPSKAPGR